RRSLVAAPHGKDARPRPRDSAGGTRAARRAGSSPHRLREDRSRASRGVVVRPGSAVDMRCRHAAQWGRAGSHPVNDYGLPVTFFLMSLPTSFAPCTAFLPSFDASLAAFLPAFDMSLPAFLPVLDASSATSPAPCETLRSRVGFEVVVSVITGITDVLVES